MEDALDMRFNYSNSLASSEEIFWNMDGVTMSQWGIFLNALRSLVGRGSIFGYLLTIVLTSCGIANNIEAWSLLNFSKKISNWNVHCSSWNSTLNLQYFFSSFNRILILTQTFTKISVKIITKIEQSRKLNPIFHRAPIIGSNIKLSCSPFIENKTFYCTIFYVVLIELRSLRKGSWKEKLNWKQFFIEAISRKISNVGRFLKAYCCNQ